MCIFPAVVFLTLGLITSYGGVASRYFAAGAISCAGTKQVITTGLFEFLPEAQEYAALAILNPAKDGDGRPKRGRRRAKFQQETELL